MARKPHPRRASDNGPDLDISSLIDVSFLLLIFFLVSSSLMKRETELPMGIGGEGERSIDPLVALDVSIAMDGRITVGGQELAGASEPGIPGEMAEVREQFLEHRRRAELLDEQPLVSLQAAGEADTQRFIDVINALSYAGIQNIALVAN